jgi:hypothetical protein
VYALVVQCFAKPHLVKQRIYLLIFWRYSTFQPKRGTNVMLSLSGPHSVTPLSIPSVIIAYYSCPSFFTPSVSKSSCVFISSFLVPIEESEHRKIERLEECFYYYLRIRCPSYLHLKYNTAETVQANTLPISLDFKTSIQVATFAVKKRICAS